MLVSLKKYALVLSHHDIWSNVQIVGCTPCGCGCPVRRTYLGHGQFKCSSCLDYCKSQGQCLSLSNTCIVCCFAGVGRLFLENGQSISMSELKVGDRVQTGIFHFK